MAVYTVRKGDTLTAIARRFNTTVAAIRALNPIVTNPDLIFVGQSLNLPGEGTASIVHADGLVGVGGSAGKPF